MGLMSIIQEKIAQKHADEFQARQDRIKYNLGLAHADYQLDPDPAKDAQLRKYYGDQAVGDMQKGAKDTYKAGVPLMNLFHAAGYPRGDASTAPPVASPKGALPPLPQTSSGDAPTAAPGIASSPQANTGGENFGPYSGAQPQTTDLGQKKRSNASQSMNSFPYRRYRV